MNRNYEKASRVIQNVWSNIDWEKVDPRRRMSIHSEFEGQVKALSKCFSRFEPFIDKLCKRMNSYIDSADIAELSDEEREAIMTIYRTETQIPMLLLRLAQDEKKERYKAKEEAKKKDIKNSETK